MDERIARCLGLGGRGSQAEVFPAEGDLVLHHRMEGEDSEEPIACATRVPPKRYSLYELSKNASWSGEKGAKLEAPCPSAGIALSKWFPGRNWASLCTISSVRMFDSVYSTEAKGLRDKPNQQPESERYGVCIVPTSKRP